MHLKTLLLVIFEVIYIFVKNPTYMGCVWSL